MGGTSTDVSLVDGEVTRVPSLNVGGFPVLSPSILMETVGAGGGSLAYVDPGGALKVGPESAGADPGPACYGKSDRPAVTDANLVLGRIPEVGLLGGEFQLDAGRARKAAGRLARAMGESVEKVAEGVIRVADATMERAIRVVSVEKGYDPRDFALVAFGGAGGLHACGLAEALGMATVLVPPQPGVLSAYGLLCAEAAEEKSRTVFLNPLNREALLRALNELRDEVREVLMEDQGPVGRVRLSPMVDLRYVGQSYEISVPFAANLIERFHKAHRRLYGHAERDSPVEAVNVRVRGVRAGPAPPPVGGADEEPRAKPKTGKIWSRGGWQTAGFFARGGLEIGRPVKGPAVVYEYSATTFVPSGWIGEADGMGNFVLRRED
jgi:N-methylhydantoinase A